MTWTQDQERRLRELEQERDILISGRGAAVEELLRTIREAGISTNDIDIDNVIVNADAIRDALKPFDSGARVEAPLRVMSAPGRE